MTYEEFLKEKIAIASSSGFSVAENDIHPILKPHQKDAVKWAIAGGCRAVFASFGLGKTVIQLEILRLILAREGGKALIVTPLNIVDEFYHDAQILLDNLPVRYIKTQEDIAAANEAILITNYERVRDGNINLDLFTACSLDEASVSDSGYDLPALNVIYHKVSVDNATAGCEDDGQVKMFRDAALGLKEASKEKRDSISDRVAQTLQIVQAAPDDHFILWHNLEAERHALQKTLPDAGFVYGSQDLEKNVEITRAFKSGKLQYLATKPDISAQGGNMQYHCHKCIFVGIDYKFNDFIQVLILMILKLQNEGA